MKTTINQSGEIQCWGCDGWIQTGERFVHDYEGNDWHGQCYADKLAILEQEYIDEYNSEDIQKSDVLKAITEEYNNITSEDLRKILGLY